MIDDSSTIAPVFISEQPDWSKPVIVAVDYKSSVAESRNETRQRARWRKQPRYSISYQASGLTMAEFSQRRAEMIGELKAPCVVPIWTDEHSINSIAGTTFTMVEDLTLKKFKVGSYGYVVEGENSSFRKIISIEGEDLIFEAGSFPAYTASAVVYPCIVGVRTKGNAAFVLHMVDRSDEIINVEEI